MILFFLILYKKFFEYNNFINNAHGLMLLCADWTVFFVEMIFIIYYFLYFWTIIWINFEK